MLRTSLLSVLVIALSAATIYGQDARQNNLIRYQPSPRATSSEEIDYASDECSACNECNDCCGDSCGKGHLLAKHRAKKQGRDYTWLWDSCNCNGSYKFPVPPLYTYHWPGLYSHRLMTDYHSPWRYPGIRPYPGDEQPGDELSERRESVRQVSQSAPRQIRDNTWERGSEPVSAKIERLYR